MSVVLGGSAREVNAGGDDDGMTSSPKFVAGTPSWVDIGTTDVEGAIEFYTQLFGWTYEQAGPESGGYGTFFRDGRQAAGIGPATDQTRGTSWTTYLSTEDAQATAEKVRAAGGQIVQEPTPVMELGTFAVVKDPSGAYFNLWQAGKQEGLQTVPEHGAFNWAELMTEDAETAKAFYHNVFGLTTSEMPAGDGGTYILLEAGEESVAGMMQNRPEWGPMASHWSVYFAVDDVDAIADRAIELGGTEMARQDSPAGRFAQLRDPQGGSFGVIANDPDFSM